MEKLLSKRDLIPFTQDQTQFFTCVLYFLLFFSLLLCSSLLPLMPHFDSTVLAMGLVTVTPNQFYVFSPQLTLSLPPPFLLPILQLSWEISAPLCNQVISLQPPNSYFPNQDSNHLIRNSCSRQASPTATWQSALSSVDPELAPPTNALLIRKQL